jgi:hypothetical protein
MLQPAVHRAILIVDVEKFGDPARTNIHQLAIRDTVYKVLQQSFARARIGWADCVTEDRGDGVLVLVPPTVPKSLLVAALPVHLAKILARHNAACPAQVRIRLRVALHAGEVHPDAHGYTGASINRAFRLIGASASRTALRHSSGVVALVVSDWFYDEVVRHHPAAEPSCFRKVHVVMKETRMTAWVRVLEPGEPPVLRDTGPTSQAATLLSHPHQISAEQIETLQDDPSAVPVIEHYRLHITLREDVAVNDSKPVITLVQDREYTVTNRNAIVARIDIFHHATGPISPQPASRTPRFTYVCMDMDNADVLEWDPECDSAWTKSSVGRSMRAWRSSDVSIGREPGVQNMFSLRLAALRMDPGSTLHAKVISETQVTATGAEPFVVFLPTAELEVVVMCSLEIDVALFPLYGVQAGGSIPRAGVAPRSDRMQEITWHWDSSLFTGQGVILRWARVAEETSNLSIDTAN